MKLTVVVVCLSVAVMTVLIYQALRQEVDLRRQKTLLVDNSAEVKRKEMAIVEAKKTIQQLKASLGTINEDIEGLKKKKEENDKAAQEFEQGLKTCNSEKARPDQEEAKKKAEQDIQGLKQQILDRDKAICAFVDTTKEELPRIQLVKLHCAGV
uniref:Si:dkey-87o1.2 n=1 Tax=Scophthalmus maximus TaxID=52904 RepID=A0A8D3DX17_SCOMX